MSYDVERQILTTIAANHTIKTWDINTGEIRR